jgi:hypothetical protein
VRTKPIICRVICEHPLFDESHALPSDDCFMTGGCDKLIEQSSPPNPELQTQTPFNKNIEYSSFKKLYILIIPLLQVPLPEQLLRQVKLSIDKSTE